MNTGKNSEKSSLVLDRDSASRVVEAATIIPSTDSGVSAATHPGWPCSSTSRCICR
jgi:hypothetical protein